MAKNSVTAGSYQYDGRGLRTVKTVNGEDKLFVYCKSGKLIAEADSNGNILKEYVYLEGDIFAHFSAVTSTPSNTAFLQAIYFLLLLQNSPDEDGDYLAEGGDIFVEGEDILTEIGDISLENDMLAESGSDPAEGAYYYINDHLGAPQIITNDAGSVVWQAEYLPFGKVNILTADIENNLRFPGQYYDTETGLHYNWNRYYSPETGRYIAADPIGLDGGMNLYAYVGSDPVNRIDPLGLNTMVIGGEIGFSLGGPAGGVVGFAIGAGLGWWIAHEMNDVERDPVSYTPFNPGKDCNGDCKPCPPNEYWEAPGNKHGATSGTHWHGIEWNQAPDCTCYPNRVSGPTKDNLK